MRRPEIPAIAAAQDGVFTRRQAFVSGLSYRRIDGLIATGRWRGVVGSAFVAGTSDVGPRQVGRALVLLTCGVVSHLTAAALFRFGLPPGMAVTIGRSRTLRLDGVAVSQCALRPDEVVDLDGIPTTSVQRTVVDLLATLALHEARTLYSRAVQQDWLQRAELARAVRSRTGWHGTPQLLRILGESVDGAHSWLEARLIRLLIDAGLTGWAANVPVTGRAGIVGIADILFAEQRLVIEVDGRRYHGDDRFQMDRTRQNQLIALGYTVLRFTYDDIVRRPEFVVATIRTTLARLS